MVEWRVIPDCSSYEVSNDGRVRRNNVELKPWISKRGNGYYTVNLAYGEIGNRKLRKFLVSRLVAIAFIPSIEGKNEVDHINRNSLDNRVENLRWANRYDQASNQDRKIGKSGHKSIHLSPENTYIVKITRNHILYQKRFKTLDEAIKYRDEFLRGA